MKRSVQVGLTVMTWDGIHRALEELEFLAHARDGVHIPAWATIEVKTVRSSGLTMITARWEE